MIRIASAVIAAASLLSIAAAPAAAKEEKSKPRDPNEVVCKKEDVLGSRLQTRKVCMTRAEWAEQRQITRQDVHRTQIGSCQRQAGC